MKPLQIDEARLGQVGNILQELDNGWCLRSHYTAEGKDSGLTGSKASRNLKYGDRSALEDYEDDRDFSEDARGGNKTGAERCLAIMLGRGILVDNICHNTVIGI